MIMEEKTGLTYIHSYRSHLGQMTMASDGRALTGLWFDGQKHFAESIKGETEDRLLPVFQETERWLDIYFEGRDPGFTPDLFVRSTPFRNEVWDILMTIPYGHTVTYGDIADVISKQRQTGRMSAQAVGGAVGRNPVSLIIPCHRVLGSDGSLTGYAGGTERKARLLDLERKGCRRR